MIGDGLLNNNPYVTLILHLKVHFQVQNQRYIHQVQNCTSAIRSIYLCQPIKSFVIFVSFVEVKRICLFSAPFVSLCLRVPLNKSLL